MAHRVSKELIELTQVMASTRGKSRQETVEALDEVITRQHAEAQKRVRKRSVVKRTLNILEILQNGEYRTIEPICASLSRYPGSFVDSFISMHYLESTAVQKAICSMLKGVDFHFPIGTAPKHRSAHSTAPTPQSLTAVLLLTLPFVAASANIQATLCQKYMIHWDKECGYNLCRGLVYALKLKVFLCSKSLCIF